MAKNSFASWMFRAKHFASGMFAGAGVDPPSVTPTLRSSTNTTAPTTYDGTLLDVFHFQIAHRHLGRYEIVHSKYDGGIRAIRSTSNTGTPTTTSMRASANTTAAESYDSTLMNVAQFQVGSRRFGRYTILHGKFDGGAKTIRSSSNL